MAQDEKRLRRTMADETVIQDTFLKHEMVKKVYDGEEYEIPYLINEKPNDRFSRNGGHSFYPPLNQRTYECLPGILCEQDVHTKLRDGATMYSDIYRPVGGTGLPVILCWTMYGKRPNENPQEWEVNGVPPGTRSKFTAFEAADPSFWCNNGYAVAVTDARGAGASEGDLNMWGEEYARDCYDYIEWIAEQWWCNGKVGMSGNSSLAMVQWYVGAMDPPHLACLAPWEGSADIYREFLASGGILNYGQYDCITMGLGAFGNRQEDYVAAFYKYPLYNSYWESKRPKVENITVPVYVTAGWSHHLHLRGCLLSFRNIKSKKWLRTHREHEWNDYYQPHNEQDLKLFLDRYLKDINNGWENTPQVRIDVMDAYNYDYQIQRPENEFPLARTQYTKLYLDATDGSLNMQPVSAESTAVYEAAEGAVSFEITFDEETELTGYFMVRIWVEADGSDDMDLYVNVQKYSADDEWIYTLWDGKKHPGVFGMLRASHRELDPSKTTHYQPYHLHTSEQLLKPGEIVPLDIEIWPHSRIWHKGEKLRVNISGPHDADLHDDDAPEYVKNNAWITRNKGSHIIHTGGKYDSYIQVPVIPPRHVAGAYIYR